MNAPRNSQGSLWERYLQTRSIELRNELVTLHAPLISKHARRLSRRLSLQVSVDEIYSAGFDGLLAAVETFQPNRNVKFETFAARRIVGAVLDWLRTVDPQSRSIRQFQRRHSDALTLASCDEGYRASGEQVAERMGLTNEQYERNLSRLRSGKSVPLSRMVSPGEPGSGSEDTPTVDIPCPKQIAPSARIERDMLCDYICRGLCESERNVLMLYYYEDLTMAETGTALGLSESRVSQIHRSVLDKLRGRFATPTARAAIA